MKRSILLLTLLLLMLAACGGEEPAAEVTEPEAAPTEAAVAEAPAEADSSQNDGDLGMDAGGFDAPAVIEPGTYSGSLPEGDVTDVYSVSSQPFELVEVTVTIPADSPTLVFSITHVGNEEWGTEVAPGTSETLVVAANTAQTNLIGFSGSAQGAISYEMTLAVVSENDANSGADAPNDPAQAAPVTLGQMISGTSIRLEGEGGHDADCYAFSLTADGSVTAEFNAPADQPYESFTSVDIYNAADGSYIWGENAEYGQSATLNYDLAAGDYALCVETYEYYPIGYYTMTVHTSESGTAGTAGTTGETVAGDSNASTAATEDSITLNKDSYEPQEEIVVTLGISSAIEGDAWVGIIPSETPHGSEADNDLVDVSYTYLMNMVDNQVTLYAPEEAGYYDVRLFNTDLETGVELASVTFSIGDVSALPTPVAMAGGTGGGNTGSNGESGGTDNGGEETAAPPETTEGNDDCLIGTWRVTNFDEYFAAIVADAMAGTGQSLEISTQSTGDLLMTFDGSTVTMTENNFVVVATAAGQTIPVDIEASGSVQYEASNGTLSPFVDAANVADTNTGFAFNISSMAGQSVTYTCNGETLTWATAEMPAPVILSRFN